MDNGGGLESQNGGTATLSNCTVSGNSASDLVGGGLCNYYPEPGFRRLVEAGTATLTNTTPTRPPG